MNWQHWAHGLVAAVIGGAANALVVAMADPAADFVVLGKVAAFGAILSAAAYLKQSPLPPE